jgi:hypothetical protein
LTQLENIAVRTVLLAICSIACAWSIVGTAGGGELPADFVNQYGPAAEKIEHAYQHATIRGSYTLAFPHDGQPGLARSLNFVLRVDGPQLSLDETNMLWFTDGRLDGDRRSRQWLVSSQRSLERWSDTDEPLTEMTPGPQGMTATEYIRWMTQINHTRSSLDATTQIDSVEESVLDGRPITTVACHTFDESDGVTVRWDKRYDFSPTEGWALRQSTDISSVVGDEHRSRFVVRIDYDGVRDGVPVIKQVDEMLDEGPDTQITQRRVTDFTEIEFGTSFDAESEAASQTLERASPAAQAQSR